MTESQPQDSTRGKKSWATSVGLDIDSISFHLQWDEPLWEALEGSHLLLSPPQKQAWETMGKTSVHLRDPSAVESTVPKQKTVRDRNARECKSSFYKPQICASKQLSFFTGTSTYSKYSRGSRYAFPLWANWYMSPQVGGDRFVC